jgi:hypothetical protein
MSAKGGAGAGSSKIYVASAAPAASMEYVIAVADDEVNRYLSAGGILVGGAGGPDRYHLMQAMLIPPGVSGGARRTQRRRRN